ncbi:MAG: hypothetical protein SNJ85_04485 [Cyanobacteriota bacterium]
MPQPVKAGLIQLSVPADGVERSVSQLKQAMIDKHLPSYLYGDLIKP